MQAAGDLDRLRALTAAGSATASPVLQCRTSVSPRFGPFLLPVPSACQVVKRNSTGQSMTLHVDCGEEGEGDTAAEQPCEDEGGCEDQHAADDDAAKDAPPSSVGGQSHATCTYLSSNHGA